MAEFKLGRIKFVWKGNWTTSTSYYVDDIVQLGGRSFICVAGHTASADFNTDLAASPAKWQVFSDGQTYKGDWNTSTLYQINDLVKYGGNLYICNDAHTSSSTAATGLEADQAKWTLFLSGLEWKGNWNTSTRYKVNDLVRYGGFTYVCNTGHTSTATVASGLEVDQVNWDSFNEGLEYKGDWATFARYKINDIIKYGAGTWICTQAHTSVGTFDATPWDQFAEGVNYESAWNIATGYQVGDIVSYGGNQYVALTQNIGANPVTATSDWSLFNEGFDFQGDWNLVATYKIGQVVRLNGYTYVAIADSLNQEPPNASYWERLNYGFQWQGEWQNSTAYKLGDVVRFETNTFVCVQAHTSADDDSATTGDAALSPASDSSGTYWNVLAIGNTTSTLTVTGDLVYYGDVGPTRLPIGTEGQVLKVNSNGLPEWGVNWETDHVYHVTTTGVDAPYPTRGSTLDTAWKTVRYACQQVELGPRNPNTKKLLELNRAFIQRETVEWVDRQISTNTSPFSGSFDYDEYKCERDVGFIVDALIFDLGHGGNVKTRGAANSYVGGLSESETEPYGVGLGNEDAESIAALNYMLTVVEAVLNQEAPAVNYQTLNGDNSTAIVGQTFDADLEAEAGSLATITSLVGIVTDAIADGTADNIPARTSPNNLIKVATGQYREVLPIIVPERTCVLGDELRSTNIGPGTGSTNIEDSKYSIGALDRLEAILSDVFTGADVTETTGNTVAQDRNWPYADSVAADNATRLVRTIQHNVDFRIGTTNKTRSSDPTGYNSGYLTGYGDARKLIKENKKFFQEEVIAFISENYSSVKYSRTICKRDVGYIVDAVVYDLTYGGNTQSLNAGLAYFDGPGGALMIDSTEKQATLAAYVKLKSLMQGAALNNAITPLQNTIPQYRDTAGSAGASTFIGSLLDTIYNIIDSGTTAAPNVTVTTIAGSNTATTSTTHNLQTGDLFVPRISGNGFTAGTIYYIKSVPAVNQFTVSTSFDGTTATLTNGSGLTIVGDVTDNPATSWVGAGLVQDWTDLSADIENIVANTTTFITTNYPSLVYNQAKCERDVRIILAAVGYDFMFDSNFQTVKAGYAYLRASASDVYDLNQKAATRAAFQYAADQADLILNNANLSATVLFRTLDDIIFSGSVEGSRCATEQRATDYAVLQLERNRDFIVAEIDAYIADTYSDTVTATESTTNLLTVGDTSWLTRNAAIRFSGTTIGGVETGTTYYVQKIVSATTFTISAVRYGSDAQQVALSDASGSMAVAMHYNSTLCLRDVNEYIDALKYDLKFAGNYKSLLAARYYANSVVGSLEEDMYYLRDGTGIRDQTLEGLTGDLLAPNAYGTSRVSAGAYCSLDPGWGPEDYRVWIIERSPYVQGVTTLGTAAVGQKIDGALHNGGNDSIVSNDFTQVISDGIGAWILNNGRAELVSVFTYYAHIGYLAESGGRIRATNGNNSYGDYGSVAEGFDTTETPNTAVVDNRRSFVATADVVVGGGNVLGLEFINAGSEYNFAEGVFSGQSGSAATAEFNEFRDDAIFQVRLLDLGDDSSGQFGGFGFLTNSSTAQTGTTSSITIAATDGETSTAYIGMKIFLDGGRGVGQFALINTYNSGTKIATVIRESDGQAGWDHVIPGTTILAPDASTTYIIEPAVSFAEPGFSSTLNNIGSSGNWQDVVYGDTGNAYSNQTGTYSGDGSGARWDVVRNGRKYTVTLSAAGTGYTRLETITIDGSTLDGVTTTNDITITITAVNSVTGAILDFDYDGVGSGGIFVGIQSGSRAGITSLNGQSWTTTATLMPSVSDWKALAHGVINDGSTVSDAHAFVAVSSTSGTVAAYSADGESWSATTLPTSASWQDVTFGNGRFVAIAANGDTAVSFDGQIWDFQGSTGDGSKTWVATAYGNGKFVAITENSNAAAHSEDGVTWSLVTLPSSLTWEDVAFGNGRFIVVASNSNTGAYSLNGTSWTSVSIGSIDDSSIGGYQRINYGQGLFMVSSFIGETASYVVNTSPDGITWTPRTVEGPDDSTEFSGYRALAFGNPQAVGYWVLLDGQSSGSVSVRVRTGARAKGRVSVSDQKIFQIRLSEPGSGYDTAPIMTITDPNNTYEVPHDVRIGKGALATPSFTSRGTGYSSGDVTITGNGYADYYQAGSVVAVRRLSQRPLPGSNVVFGHLPNNIFKLVSVTTFLGANDGSYTAFFQVSPTLTIEQAPEHLESITTRIRYSQTRLTGHDFLDIGTGNFANTNYPDAPLTDPIQDNETHESNGGRVFYTSTDQDGNFRVGDLFTIEQSTGIATLNADAFNIAGLQELTLGEVTLGGGSATVTEFSTDPFFTANSDTVVPTQRAIRSYIASQIGGGNASINVNSVTAGSIVISGNTIASTATIQMNGSYDFRGGLRGLPVAFSYFLL